MHKGRNLSSISVHRGTPNCHFCHWAHTFFAGICAISEAGPVASACPPPNVIWQNKGSRHSWQQSCRRKFSGIYKLSCGRGNVALNSGCLCVRPQTQRRRCLSCFFCLPCVLHLSCSSSPFLLGSPSLDVHPPLMSPRSLLDISVLAVIFLSISPRLFDALAVGLNDWSHKALPPTLARRAELSCATLLILLLSPSERRRQSVTQMLRWVVWAQVGG